MTVPKARGSYTLPTCPITKAVTESFFAAVDKPTGVLFWRLLPFVGAETECGTAFSSVWSSRATSIGIIATVFLNDI